MNKPILFILILIFFLAAGIFVWQFELRKKSLSLKEIEPPQKIEIIEKGEEEKKPLIKVEIQIPQAIKTGESFKGYYSLLGNEEDLVGKILIICHSKEGAEFVGPPLGDGFPCIARLSPPLGTYELSAFRITDRNQTSGRTDFFYSPGTYTFSITLHECSKVKEIFPESEFCGWNIDNRDIVSKVPYLLKETASIIVTGEEVKPECGIGALEIGCKKKPCEGCDMGPVCLYPHQKCVECTEFFKCREGYVCVDYKCVKKE